MPAAAEADSLLRAFADTADGAAMKSRDLSLQLLAHSATPFSRLQFTPGHITCTGLVLSPDDRCFLLVHHRRLDRWLLPGGHVESYDVCLRDAARREVLEETGVALQPGGPPGLAGVDVHGIPPRGKEPLHLHHDLVFLFHAESVDFRVSPESRAVAWCGPGEFDRYALPDNIRRVWARVRADAAPLLP